MRAFSGTKIVIFLITAFVILRAVQFANLSEISLPHDAIHYLLLGESLASGDGFTSNSIWAISLRPQSIPFPDFYRSPGLPLLYSLAFRIFGTGFLQIKILTIILSAFIIYFTYLFGKTVTKNKNLAFLSSLLLVVNPVFYQWSGQFLAELPYGLFSLIALYFLFSSKGKKWVLIGIFWGLTYLCRYQAMALLGIPILFYVVRENGVKVGIKYSLLTVGLMLLTIAPWLYRNFTLTGDFFYTDLKYHLAAVYQNDMSHYFFGLQHPPEAINSFLSSPVRFLSYFFLSLYKLLVQIPQELFGGLTAFFLSIFGIINLWLKTKKETLTLVIYMVINLLFFSFSLPETRYLFPLLPIVMILVVCGINDLWKKAKSTKEQVGTLVTYLYFLLFGGIFYYFNSLLLKGYRLDSKKELLNELIIIVLIVIGFRFRNIFNTITKRTFAFILALVFAIPFIGYLPASFFYSPQPTALEAYNLVQMTKKLNISSDAVFMTGGMPYYFEYYLQRPVIQFPYYSNPTEFNKIVKQYGIKYFIITKTQKEFYPWLTGLLPPDFATIARKSDITVYVQK